MYMNLEVKQAFKDLYTQMFMAAQSGNRDEAKKFRSLMDNLRLSHISCRRNIRTNFALLSDFAKQTLNKNQHDLGILSPSNCINAALNYQSKSPQFEPYTPKEFLDALRKNYTQISKKEEL